MAESPRVIVRANVADRAMAEAKKIGHDLKRAGTALRHSPKVVRAMLKNAEGNQPLFNNLGALLKPGDGGAYGVPARDGSPVKAYGNRNAAISVLTDSGLFGLKPGEFEWVEQAEWVVALGAWVPVDGQPARVVRNLAK